MTEVSTALATVTGKTGESRHQGSPLPLTHSHTHTPTDVFWSSVAFMTRIWAGGPWHTRRAVSGTGGRVRSVFCSYARTHAGDDAYTRQGTWTDGIQSVCPCSRFKLKKFSTFFFFFFATFRFSFSGPGIFQWRLFSIQRFASSEMTLHAAFVPVSSS